MMSQPATEPATPLARLDRWMASSPFWPRLVPFMAFVLFLMPIGAAYAWNPCTYPFMLAMQAAIVVALLWRYRAMTPEITFKLHGSAIVAGVLGAVAWIGLGLITVDLIPALATEPDNFFVDMAPYEGGEAWAWASLIARLLVTAMIVPVFEELFFRSALLRSMQRWKPTQMATIQLLDDLPVIGDLTMRTKLSKESDAWDRPLEKSFHATPLGRVTLFAVVANVVLWCPLSHGVRDWPGTIACGLLYIGVCWYTNARGDRRMGLGPVIWAHGITNALLVVYTLRFDDWQFL
jgi:membrane protease YdiL (CAAX protease family)